MEDELFAAKYDNPDKNIDDCVTYILNWVQKSGCNGFCDDEIYGQAIHYYEEKDIEVGKPLNCQVSVNHHIELTEEEKACPPAVPHLRLDSAEDGSILRYSAARA